MGEDSYEENKLKFTKSVLNEIRYLRNLREDRVGEQNQRTSGVEHYEMEL